MEINFDYPDDDLDKIKEILIESLKLPNDEDLNEKLNDIARAAFDEYINMISGSGMPTKVTDIIQNRIISLIENYFNRFPNEDELSLIFNITNSKSRNLLTNLKASHRNFLREKLKTKIIEFIHCGIELDDNKWEFEVKSRPIVVELNELISVKAPGLEKFKNKSGSSGKVTLHVDSLNFLKQHFDIG